MQDKELYSQILGITQPWTVVDVSLNLPGKQVIVSIQRDPKNVLACPMCEEPCAGYDTKVRSWRHLDTCQLQTVLKAEVPRASCSVHGVHQIKVPWGEPGSPFTAMFEAMVIAWLRAGSIKDVAQLVGLTWDQVDGVMERAVRRGLERRKDKPIRLLGLDETSYQKHHEYVTILLDRERNVVVEVLDDRLKNTLADWPQSRPSSHVQAIENITMDMWPAYINALLENVPGADSKICFDRFHVAGHFSKALDLVRSEEHRELRKLLGKSPLLRTKHHWLRNSRNIDNRSRRTFFALTKTKLRTARAWAIKETAASLWSYVRKGSAQKAWECLLSWIARCRLLPIVKVGQMVREHLWGILNAIMHQANNAMSEAKNAGIQKIKARACGFRSRARFRRAILFHFGGLDLMPSLSAFW
jgi:transposase